MLISKAVSAFSLPLSSPFFPSILHANVIRSLYPFPSSITSLSSATALHLAGDYSCALG